MSFFRKQNKAFIIQTLFGLFPYRINTENGRVEFHLFAWIYSIILHCTISVGYLSVIVSFVNQEGIRKMFLDSRIACRFLQILNLEFVYFGTVLGILFDIRKYAKFFNKMNKVDRKVDKHRKQSDDSEARLLNAHALICVIYFLLYFTTRLSFISTAEVVSSFCYTFKILAITFVAIFLRQIASTLNNKMEVVISALDVMSQENCKNVQTISECITIFSELSHCKQLLSTIFGLQLFLSFFFDFIGVTIILYLSSSNVAIVPNSRILSYTLYIDVFIRVLLYVLPVIVKEILLVLEMDKLGQTVICLSCC